MTGLAAATLVPSAAWANDPVLAAAGDIACPPAQAANSAHCQQTQTSALVQSANPSPTAVAELGDEQYNSGLLSEFQGSYDHSWGPLDPVSHPVPGNHEYEASATAAGYFAYFGGIAGPTRGYYSYDLGQWHIVALNSNCTDSVCSNIEGAGGAVSGTEVQWLQSDLAAHQGQCTLAYWHHPLFSQGYVHGGSAVKPLWDALYAHGADVVANGHDHVYERYAQLSPSGTSDSARGLREFVSGEGGRNLPGFPSPPAAPVEHSDGSHFGVLFLTLHAGSYDWAFRDVAGTTLDSGTANCHEPEVSVTASPSDPRTQQAVSFDAHATTPDAVGIQSYSWNFGDGTTSTEASPSHSYPTAASYTVSVTVTSNSGVSTTKQMTLAVSDRPPTASFTATPDPVLTGNLVAFDATASSDSDGKVTGYSWDFGDGSTSTAANPSHSYATANSYQVTLTVTDDSGHTSTTSRTVTVTDRPPTSSFTAQPNPVAPKQPVAFSASASQDPDGHVTGYTWHFGDGSTANGVAPSHSYTTAGAYSVTLTVTDDSASSTSSTSQVTVDQPPVASVRSSTALAAPGQSVSLDASGSYDPDGSITSYSWDLGDGRSASGVAPSHSYVTAGTYSVTVTVTDNNGFRSSATTRVVVDQPPAARFSASPDPTTPGQTVTFDGSPSSDPDGTVSGYSWDFGDGHTDTGQSSSHTYAMAGTYTVALTVTDNSASTATTTHAVTVNAPAVAPRPSGTPGRRKSHPAKARLSLAALDTSARHALSGGLRLILASTAPGLVQLRLTVATPRPGHHTPRPALLATATVRLAALPKRSAIAVHVRRGARNLLRHGHRIPVSVSASLRGAGHTSATGRWQIVLRR